MNPAESKRQFGELQQRMRACRACLEAGHQVTPPAVTQGNIGARIMTIGQAPGVTEVKAKRPFNAGSGTRLFQWLAAAGIDENWFRSTQYMTAVTKCFPGKASSGGGDRVPSAKERALCRPFLDAELALVQPALIIPIGRLAIELFFPQKGSLEELIGTENLKEGRWIVPLPHPSGASRWHQIAENKVRIDQAIGLIANHYRELFID